MLRKICLIASCLTALCASGTWSFGEFGGLREVYGLTKNRSKDVFRQIYGIHWVDRWDLTVYTQYYPNPTGILRNNLAGFRVDGRQLNNPKIGGTIGMIGKTDSGFKDKDSYNIASYEDIFFTMAVLRDRVQRNNDGTAKMEYNTVGAELSKYCRSLGALYDYFGLQPYAAFEESTTFNCTSIYRFNLVNNWKDFVKVDAYVELGHHSNNFIKSDKAVFTKDDDFSNDYSYGFRNYKTAKSNAELRKYNEEDRISPELYTYFTSETFSTLDRAQASFYVKTLHKCKQRVLYRIEVKRITIPGSNRDYTIYDSYPSAGKTRCQKAWYDFVCTGLNANYNNTNEQLDYCGTKAFLNQAKKDGKGKWGSADETWWGLTKVCTDTNGKECDEKTSTCTCVRATCTGDIRTEYNGGWANDSLVYNFGHLPDNYVIPDYEHHKSEPFYFYVVQDKHNENDAIDCLPTPNTTISSIFLENEPQENGGLKYKYSGKENDNIKDIYTYVQDGKDNKNIYLKINANADKGSTFISTKDPFTDKNESYFSIDMGDNANYKYYIQSDCVDFNDSSCKYTEANKISNKEASLTDKNGLTYSQICKMAQKNSNYALNSKEANALCDPNDAKRKNERFFKFNNAILQIQDLKLPEVKNKKIVDNDKQRREFKIRFYHTYKYVGRQADEIKHRPITIRPESYEAHTTVCDVFDKTCNNKSKNKTLQATIFKDGDYYLSAFKYRVFDSANKTEYYFDANASDDAINFNTNNENNLLSYTNASTKQSAIIPFVSANKAAIIFKEDHIKRYLLDNGDYTASESCIDNNDYLVKAVTQDAKTKANTRSKENNFKLYCQTPMDNIINISYKNIKYDLNSIKDNIDNTARVNTVITSNQINKQSYRLHPKITISANNEKVVKYFDKDLNAKLTLNFDSDIDYSKLNILANSDNTFSSNISASKNNFSISKYIVNATDIKKKAGVNAKQVIVEFKLTANNLNNVYDNMLNDILKDKTTFYLITHKENKQYARIEKYSNITNLSEEKVYASANENAYEIPLTINYIGVQAKPFILQNAKFELFDNNNKELKFDNVSVNASKEQTLNTMFVYALPIFKDKKSNENVIFITNNDVKLRYLDGVYKDFEYIINNSEDFSFKTDSKCVDSKEQVVKPCFRIVNAKYPGLSYDTEFISDYGMKITKCKSLSSNNCVKANKGDNVEGLKLELVNANTKNATYVKDTVHCYGGEYNCNSNFTIERIKN